MNIKRKDLIGTTTELQKVQQEVQSLRSDLKAKDEERKALQKNYEAQCQQLQTKIYKLQMEEKQKCEDIVFKTKDNLECQLQRQAQQHQKYVQKLREQFRMQWEEHTKNTSFNSRRGMEGMCKS
ncbi:hypothetical protein KC19_5G149600 [Ceratodon purpureus]|uniref:Uncharacterized protein n=1 Tax=Ceratodon purpureus TaxID=3225 RepID=A0A8T0I2V3_CERPU|nr:hypothetical protein KC19_5G149600 [Ceratodon purpureus]